MSIGNDAIPCYTNIMFVANSDNILGDQSFRNTDMSIAAPIDIEE